MPTCVQLGVESVLTQTGPESATGGATCTSLEAAKVVESWLFSYHQLLCGKAAVGSVVAAFPTKLGTPSERLIVIRSDTGGADCAFTLVKPIAPISRSVRTTRLSLRDRSKSRPDPPLSMIWEARGERCDFRLRREIGT